MTLRLERIDYPSAAFDALVPEWEALDARVSPRTPFTSPNWVRLWWTHFRRNTISTRDEFFLHALRDGSGRLIAVAPLMLTRRPARGPFQLRVLQFIGADPSITEVRGIICDLESHDLAFRELLEYFSRHQDQFDIFIWHGVRDVGSVVDSLRSLGGAQHDMLPAYLLELPESWEKLLAGLSSNMRKSLRKSYEFLERDGHKFVFRSLTKPGCLDAGLRCFLSLHAARSTADEMKMHPDRFNGHFRHLALVTDFAREMAESNRLHMLQLEIAGEVVATRIAFQLGDDLYLYYSGFDPKWKQYSVMTTLVSEAIKWALSRGFKRVNLSTGNDLGKLRWRPTEVRYHNGLVLSPTWRGRFASLAVKAAIRLRERPN